MTGQVNGILQLSLVDSVANREAYVRSTASLFQVTLGKTIIVDAILQFNEANTNQAAVTFGLMDSVALGALQDDTGVPRATFTGACIFKAPGSTVWQTCSSVGTTRNVNTTAVTAGGNAFQRLRVQIDTRPDYGLTSGGVRTTGTLAEISYFVDGDQLAFVGGRPGRSTIKDRVTFTGASAMQQFVGVKNGSATPETLNVDWMGALDGR